MVTFFLFCLVHLISFSIWSNGSQLETNRVLLLAGKNKRGQKRQGEVLLLLYSIPLYILYCERQPKFSHSILSYLWSYGVLQKTLPIAPCPLFLPLPKPRERRRRRGPMGNVFWITPIENLQIFVPPELEMVKLEWWNIYML